MSKKTKNVGGRPPEITDGKGMFAPEVLKKLDGAFLAGLSNRQACFYADISEKYFYEILNNNPGLSDRFKALQEDTKIQALRNVVAMIKGDVSDLPLLVQKALAKERLETSKWYLERRDANKYAPQKPAAGSEDGEQPVGYIYSGEVPQLAAGKAEEEVKKEESNNQPKQ